MWFDYVHRSSIWWEMQCQVHHSQLRVSGVSAFTKRGLPLSEEDTTNTRRIANVRVHVERVIRRLKNSRIVSQTVPISLAQKFDKILCESVQVYVIFVGTLYKMRNKMFNQL